MAAVVFIDVQRTKTRWPLKRPQRWTWVALTAGNHRVLARSSEMYTNRSDCVDAVRLLFGSGANVYRREEGSGDVMLRLTTNQL